MAFKAINRADFVRVAVSTDPALDKDKCDFEKYYRTFDKSHLSFIDGEEPTWFVLGTISFMKFQEIKDRNIKFEMGVLGSQNIRTNLFGLSADALAHSLRKIENGPFEVKLVGGRVSDKTLDQLAAIGVVEELGNIALDLNGFSDADEKK